MVEENLTDYRIAKQKALHRIGGDSHVPLPTNADIHAAVLDYLAIFGGNEHASQLLSLRKIALNAMRLLADFSPKLVGAVATGAITKSHRIQLHVFTDSSEQVDMFFLNRAIPFEQDERIYRYAGGKTRNIPLLKFDADGVGVDVAIFDEGGRRQKPLSPLDGNPVKRLSESQLLALIETGDSVKNS